MIKYVCDDCEKYEFNSDELKKYNQNSIVTINCPNVNDSRDIWYIEQDQDPEFSNYIDIVMEKNQQASEQKG